MLHNKVFVDVGDALFVHLGVSSRQCGANSTRIRDYLPIQVAEITHRKETFSAIIGGRHVRWTQL